MMHCQICHQPFIPEWNPPCSWEIVEGEPLIVHKHCAEAASEKFQKIKDERERKAKILQFLKVISAAVIVLAFLLCCAAKAFGQEKPVVDIKNAKRGCTHVVGMRSLSVYYEKVLVVAKKPNLDEDGKVQDEYWVVFVDRAQNRVVKDGKTYLQPENVPGDQVLFTNSKDGPVVVMHHMKVCKCPAFFWGAGNSDVSADH